ncbi:MAG TPA: hypothetical protein V6D02_05350 [Candidatus Obscuribacterales bacterium]
MRLHGDGDIFECLYCRHTEDLTPGRRKGLGWFLATLLGIFVGLALVAG